MSEEASIVSDVSILGTVMLIVIGLIILGVRLHDVQINGAADYIYEGVRQRERRLQIGGERGRILDRNGIVLAENRSSRTIAVMPEYFQQRTWNDTIAAISNAIENVSKIISKPSNTTGKEISRHVKQSLALPLAVWRDIDDITLAKFCEHEHEAIGFEVIEDVERYYPCGSIAAHLIGYVGRDIFKPDAGDVRFSFLLKEMKGRSGLEAYYDEFLRGVPGERELVVDARGFAVSGKTVVEPNVGPDLTLSIDTRIQRVVENELSGLRGACVVVDPRNGEILALASAPSYNPNDFVPTLSQELYDKYAHDSSKPLLNRASGGAYAPGSTFKPIVALAGLTAGYPEDLEYECDGVFEIGGMKLHCSRRWGHGPIDMRNALKESCNTFFSNLGTDIGTNAIINTAREFGLGSKTGIDFGIDMAGTVPDAEWKSRMYNEKWYPGDVAQMSIGQGMLLVSPLQMALVAGAIGTGYRVTPHLKKDLSFGRQPLSFKEKYLNVVREGMRMVVSSGTGKRGGEGVPVEVAGKTGTAEVGIGSNRRKNTWFIAYAPVNNPSVAVAMVIENGASGGGTTAPKVREVLKAVFR